MPQTNIEWTDYSWNPLRARDRNTGKAGHYCELIAPECAHCYASAMQPRFGLPLFTGPSQRETRCEQVELFLDKRTLVQPLSWTRPRRVFVCSMTDVFGHWVSDEWLDEIFAVMALAPNHTFQVLTKRPERMLAYLRQVEEEKDMNRWACAAHNHVFPAMGLNVNFLEHFADVIDEWEHPLPNVWLGISAGTQKQLDLFGPTLVRCATPVHFVSAEPLLEDLDFDRHLYCPLCKGTGFVQERHDFATEQVACVCMGHKPIQWVIVGGESGPDARVCRVEWSRSIIRQCREAGVACFHKQLGTNVTTTLPSQETWPGHDGPLSRVQFHGDGFGNYHVTGLRNRKGGEMEEWPADLRVRQYPEVSQ